MHLATIFVAEIQREVVLVIRPASIKSTLVSFRHTLHA